MRAKVEYQLWCYYETPDEWKMEGFYVSVEKADEEALKLRNDVDTPCMPDWRVVKVETWE